MHEEDHKDAEYHEDDDEDDEDDNHLLPFWLKGFAQTAKLATFSNHLLPA